MAKRILQGAAALAFGAGGIVMGVAHGGPDGAAAGILIGALCMAALWSALTGRVP